MIPFIQDLQPYLSFIKDIVTIISLIVGGGVAIIGLQTWKRQLQGTAKYELARRTLKAIYQLKDAVNNLRYNSIYSYEIEDAIEKFDPKLRKNNKSYLERRTCAVFNLRWVAVAEAGQNLQVEGVEIEALLGRKVRKIISDPIESVNLLNDLYSQYDYYAHCSPVIREKSDEYKRIRKMIFANMVPEKDEFKNRFYSELIEIEELLKPYLQK
jgi:hypothetical protein